MSEMNVELIRSRYLDYKFYTPREIPISNKDGKEVGVLVINDWTPRKIGMVALFKIDGKIISSWSICDELDQFSRKEAKKVAKDRAIRLYSENKDRQFDDCELEKIPHYIRKQAFIELSNLYSDYKVLNMK